MPSHDCILVGTLPIRAETTELEVRSTLAGFLAENHIDYDKEAEEGNISFADNKLFLSLGFFGYGGHINDDVNALVADMANIVDGHGHLEMIDQDTVDSEAHRVPYFVGANDFEEKLAGLEYGILQMEDFVRPLVGDARFAHITAGMHEAMKQYLAEGGFFVPTEKVFEFAVEFGFRFEHFEVRGVDEKAARAKLWDEILTCEQKDAVSSIECTGVKDS